MNESCQIPSLPQCQDPFQFPLLQLPSLSEPRNIITINDTLIVLSKWKMKKAKNAYTSVLNGQLCTFAYGLQYVSMAYLLWLHKY